MGISGCQQKCKLPWVAVMKELKLRKKMLSEKNVKNKATKYFLCFFLPPKVRPRFTQPAKMRKRVIARPVGSSVRLKCTASGNPRPDIVWLKDDRPLTEQEVGEGREKKWTLSLKNLTPEHSGRYTCRVSNRAGEINATYKVEVIRECPTERLSCVQTRHLHLEILVPMYDVKLTGSSDYCCLCGSFLWYPVREIKIV